MPLNTHYDSCIRRYAILLFVATLFQFSCSRFVGKFPGKALEAIDPETQNLVLALKEKNSDLKTFKGLGKIKWVDKGKKYRTRIAWIGSTTGELRLEMFGTGGQMLVSIATDGKYVYFFSHSQGRFAKTRSTEKSLQNIISIPISIHDVVLLLSGRLPFRAHYMATLGDRDAKPGSVLVLKDKRGNLVEKIYLDSEKMIADEIEIYGFGESLKYRARFEKVRTVNGYQVPFRLFILNDGDSKFELDVDKFWTDVSVSPKMFVLKPPR
ncbi:hypothetical protein ACFL9U_01310 [Thermodesulfobacteriota bacterium]